ncbi:GNAT family N-acetyltransferase [Chitinophaga horti]|uniref:GNAT family N-acetyltransferase n=1 Tax=Chitinophaga horti TaxID=2920382 RepID=A0ABY6J3E3_9BACT|nr:GNAT family N-acetyltransferase [Chitinophaga horti]UYQ94193.1 GNAT family N-acetyltransferase [Chitinophaga horti]
MPNIIPYTPAHREDCLTAFHSNRPKYFTEEEVLLFTNWLDQHGDDNFFVMEHEGKIVACGGVFHDAKQAVAGLAWGMVHQDYHKKGFGKLFTLFRIDLMRQLFPDFLHQMNTTQHTVAFYEKMGFHTVKITPDGFAPGYDRYDMEGRWSNPATPAAPPAQ